MNVHAREAVIPVVFGRRLAQSLRRVAGHYSAEIWHVELSEKPPNVTVAVQIALNT